MSPQTISPDYNVCGSFLLAHGSRISRGSSAVWGTNKETLNLVVCGFVYSWIFYVSCTPTFHLSYTLCFSCLSSAQSGPSIPLVSDLAVLDISTATAPWHSMVENAFLCFQPHFLKFLSKQSGKVSAPLPLKHNQALSPASIRPTLYQSTLQPYVSRST